MEVRKGTHRIVVLFKHFVIKLPRIKLMPRALLAVIKHPLKKNCYDRVFYAWHAVLGAGLKDSWSEYRIWRKTHRTFFMPVYFCLFGLLSIQKRSWGEGNIPLKDFRRLFSEITHSTGGDVMLASLHMFGSQNNFMKESTGYKLIDYGDHGEAQISALDFFTKHGDAIERALSLE